MTTTPSPQNGGHLKRALHFAFGWIEEPRVVRVLCFLAYLIAAYGAYVALFDPPRTIEGAVGIFFMGLIGVSFALGSVIASIAVLPGWWWMERAGLLALIVGFIAYAFVVISLSLSETEDLNRGLQTVAVLIALIALVIRIVSIRGSDLDPKV